jgi:hypothetical protein
MGDTKITPAGVVLGIIALFLMWQAGLFDQMDNNAENVSDAIQTNVDSIKDIDYSGLLDAGKTICNIDNVLVEKILFDGIHEGMFNNVGWTERAILLNWNENQTATVCEIAILDDMFSKNENGNVWKNQLGIKSAMKNVQACTIIECVDEYGLIELLEDKK